MKKVNKTKYIPLTVITCGCSGYNKVRQLLQRGIRSSPETPNLTELAESVDDTLFQRIMHNPYHVLYHLLPERRELV